MPDVYQEVRDWLRARPDWQQQAAEILLASGIVSDADMLSLAQRLKTPEGQQVTTHRTFASLGPTASSSQALRLVEIGEISGIENLNPRNPLAFGDGNLSVIYGHNGSGKSGYTRLLKKICGKPRASELKTNVFNAPPAVRKCRISYRLGEEIRQVEWPATAAPIGELRPVDIFDTDEAVFYLKEETAVAYVPPAVALFEALASVCDRTRDRLHSEQSALVSALPSLPHEYVGTEAGGAYRALNPQTTDVAVGQLTRWSEKDEQAVEALSQRLSAVDPAALARSKLDNKVQIDDLLTQLRAVATAYSETSLTAIRSARVGAQAKRRIATEGAQVDAAKLDGVGSDTWRAMWEAARAYSKVAYAERDYPASNDGDRCVLCHQVLDAQARARLVDFETFVQGALERVAGAAEAAYRQLFDALPAALTADQITRRCQAAGLADQALAQKLGEFWGQVAQTREALIAHESASTALGVGMPDETLALLEARSRSLAQEAEQHERDALAFDRAQATRDKLALEARRWMSQQADAILAEVARLRDVAKYDEWKRLADSRGISRKAGEIAERVITQAFVDRFNRELAALGATRIKVELVKTRTDRGRVLHRIRLKGAQSGVAVPEGVLSEGERRIVGLAAFLSDVADQPHPAPFVFDDPISSLDHDFEWQVATRLATLAQTRQVLVFTHRLSLYGAMEDAAKKSGEDWKKKHLVKHCIEAFSGAAGHPAEQAAWNANTTKANNILIDRLNAAKKAAETGGAEAYR
ncbi:MAG: AAA family ATPase, partial [Xanthomonadales bacterium]|nr:AAA family ATPase [Xanthomonadales bacterium]